MNIQMTNDGFGLLRVLGPQVTCAFSATVVALVVYFIVSRVMKLDGGEKSTLRKIIGWIWFIVVVATVISAVSMTASLRIPRSDVNATGVYQQMDRAIEGKSK